jgi:hypothetical protein
MPRLDLRRQPAIGKTKGLSWDQLGQVRKKWATERPDYLIKSISYITTITVTLQRSLVRSQYRPPIVAVGPMQASLTVSWEGLLLFTGT